MLLYRIKRNTHYWQRYINSQHVIKQTQFSLFNANNSWWGDFSNSDDSPLKTKPHSINRTCFELSLCKLHFVKSMKQEHNYISVKIWSSLCVLTRHMHSSQDAGKHYTDNETVNDSRHNTWGFMACKYTIWNSCRYKTDSCLNLTQLHQPPLFIDNPDERQITDRRQVSKYWNKVL